MLLECETNETTFNILKKAPANPNNHPFYWNASPVILGFTCIYFLGHA